MFLSFLLLGDACIVRAEEETPPPVTIPITWTHHRVMIPAQINGSKTVSVLLDNGFTIPTLHPSIIDELGLQPSGSIRISGIAGEERAPTYRGIIFNLGTTSYAPRRVAAIPSERDRRRRRDGVIDAGLFRQFVVEI
ncbi:MAG TPA: aspartyl protease family protein, partial [Chthoniobacteraceae bacterium]|nr:aspartyl protease family protein [Chthoniobacteraceae bacterium]